MKTIIITGGRGLLATELTKQLLKSRNVYIVLISRHPERITKKQNLRISSLSQLMTDKDLTNRNYDALVHTAFSRSYDGRLLLSSLNYLEEVIYISKQIKLKSFINISSQSVYGNLKENDKLYNEASQIAPNDAYGIAKSLSEVLVNSLFENDSINYSNIRLASLLSHKEKSRFINKLVERAKNIEDLNVYGGKQEYSFIDVRDAADGIMSMIERNDKVWERIYNLGSGKVYSLYNLAEMVVEIAKNKYNKNIKINIIPSDNNCKIGMDTSLFKRDFSWLPKIDIKTSIINLFDDETINCC